MTLIFRAALLGFLVLFCAAMSPAYAEGTWEKAGRMNEGGVLIQAAKDGTDIYVAGGSTVTGPRASFDLYDTANRLWRPLPPMPAKRERFGMAAFSGRVYVSGGRVQNLDDAAPGPDDALWVYDTVSGDWVMKAQMPSQRIDHAMVNIGDKLYVVGGTGKDAGRIYVYDIVTDKWSISKAGMKNPRKGFGVTSDETSVYLLGGVTLDGRLSDRVDVLDVDTLTWSARAPLPDARIGLAAALIDGTLHVAGGSIPEPSRVFNDHWALAADGEWHSEAAVPSARHSVASLSVGNKWYLIGGASAAGFYTLFAASDVVEVYSSQ